MIFQKTLVLIFFLGCLFFISKNGWAKPPLKAQKGSYSYDWFWCFYERETKPNFSSVTYRPFYLKNKEPHNIFTASLMPFLYWSYKTDNKREWKSFLGFMGAVDYKHSDGRGDYDYGVFPFFYYGRSENSNDNYLMFWPLGGILKGKLGHDEIKPYLFPGVVLFFLFPPASFLSFTSFAYFIVSCLPAYVSYRHLDYKAWGIFWPFIQRGVSPKRDDFRIIPFYAHNSKVNFYDNYSFLLFFNYRKNFYKQDTHYTIFVTPFWGRKWSDSKRISSFTVLWPFFSWGYDRRKGNLEYNLPWPLVQIQDCHTPYIKKRIFFPFYGSAVHQNDHGTNETFFVTPFHFSLKKTTRRYTSEYYVNFFIIWYLKRDYVEKHEYYGTKWRYFKIWPLVDVEYNDQGNLSVNIFSLFPFRDPEGYEKMYQPFWTLFEYKKLSNGERRLGLLFRTYFQRWGEDFLQIKIPFLLTYENNENKLTELSLLSLFSYTNDRSGKYLRLFFLPIKLGEGDAVSLADRERDINPQLDFLKESYFPHSFFASRSARMDGFEISNQFF